MNLGKALKICRAAKNMSLEDVSSRTQISVSYLSRLENGRREAPFELVAKLASALDLPLALLVFLASEPNELKGIDKATAERFADLALELLKR
jgi:transcriptional regulator with XRE-family HTH domain